jgi:voltage-gated potassium channel
MTIKERLCFIRKAFSTTKNEMLISLCIIIVLTCILSLIFLTVERIAQPDVFADYGDAIVWAYTRYMEGGDAVFEGGPVTVVGKVIASLLGIIGIAIVAIPAGLVGSGFMDAIAEEKREKELAELRHRMLKQFPRFVSPAFNSYRKTLEASTEWENARFTTRAQLMSCFQTRLGMDFKDIADVCTRYPEFSLRDIAEELSDEENQQSTFWIELLPKNRPYGCFINRGSRVTIMVTNGFEDMGTSWLGYHVALLGGFNFICKNQEVDPDDLDSYYALTPEVSY